MPLFTGKGDGGTTKVWGCDQRLSKSSAVAEALGSLDEINSLLGVVKLRALEAGQKEMSRWLAAAQQNLFTIQAEVASAPKKITLAKVRAVEKIINQAEKELPPIKSFFVAGGTMLGASLDQARTVARRAERAVVRAAEANLKLGSATLPYLNRLSSLLYALARLANHRAGVKEEAPTYR